MGQECCQVATNDQIFVSRRLLIAQNQFHSLPQIDIIDPLLLEKVPNLKQLNVFKNPEDNRYFIGNWSEGQAEGRGTLYLPQHLLYQGNFSNGTPSGQGHMLFLNKNQEYEGNFHAGKADGQGLYKNNIKKFTFEGEWKNSKPQKGILTFEDNLNIQKIQIDDFQMGKAHILYKDLRQYHGSINRQLFIPEGEGELKFVDDSSYKGGWKNGMMHGYGVYQWKDGSKYEGNYVNGKKQGNGVFYYSSGKQYVGMWSNGKQQGTGKIITKDGEIQKEGIWKNGSFEKSIQVTESKQQVNQ